MPSLNLTEKLIILAVSSAVICFLLLALGRNLKRRRGVGLGVLYKLFCGALAVYLPVRLLDIQFDFRRELGAATALLSAFFFIAIIKRYVWEIYFQDHRQIKIPKLLSDVITLFIFVGTLVLIWKVGYGREMPSGFLTGSGIIAVIIGLAMQDLLSNIIAGFAIHFGKPFRVGDWLALENRHAEVIEVNWRSTRLRTNDHVCLDIPNRELSRQTIINLHYPTKLHAMRMSVGVDYNLPPDRVKDVMIRAATNAGGVLPEPKPKVFLKNFGDHAIEYELKFWMNDHAHYNEISDAIRSNIWYEFHRQGIKIPFPVRTLQIERRSVSAQPELFATARAAIRQLPVLNCLDDAHLDAMLPRARFQRFGRGEKIIEQGHDGTSMFVLIRGEAKVLVNHNGALTQVAVLRPSDCFGEMSLLTGEKRSATVVAQGECEILEIDKPMLADVIAEHPHLLQTLSELLAKRRLENESALAEASQKHAEAMHTEYATTFLNKLRRVFDL